MRPETSLVSVMTVNNEIGVRQPVEEIGTVFTHISLFLTFVIQNTLFFRSTVSLEKNFLSH